MTGTTQNKTADGRYQLRGGHLTHDPKLDRIPQYDERSRLFNIVQRREVPSDLTDKVYTLARNRFLNQNREGACVGAGVSHDLAASPVAIGSITMDWAREAIYWEAQRNDPWEGGSYPGGAPVYEGTSVLAGVQAARALGFYEGFEWAFGIDDGLRSLVHVGPGIAGLPWRESMFHPRPSGLLEVHGEIMGGHCVFTRGLKLKPRLKGEAKVGPVIVVPQSWGLDHGNRGEVYIPVVDFAALLQEDGEWCFPFGRKRAKVRMPQAA